MSSTQSPLTTLRRFVRQPAQVPRCEVCGANLADEHPHLMEIARRRVVCSCAACAVLFSGEHTARYRTVPRRVEFLSGFQMSDGQWEDLHLPINLAFFYYSSPVQKMVAMFPSPAGATESQLAFASWAELADANPVLRELENDVEALLINRVGELREYYRVPIDECFKLVGLIRSHWRGLSGGTEVWGEIARFTGSLKDRSCRT